MKQVIICLGILLLIGAFSLAQTPAQQADQQNSSAASKSNDANTSAASQTHTKPNKADDGFDKPSGHRHIRMGGIAVSGGYSHFSGFYPYPYAFAYDPFFYPFSAVSMAMLWDPFWGYYPPFYPAGYFGPGNGKGELKLTGAPKDAVVYLNGGYAGTVEHLKSFWLDPGAYDLAVTTADGRRFQQRVYMLTGKTLKLEAKPMEKPKEGENL
jgi:hypothetical protein